MKQLMKILVAYDGSFYADQALNEAIDLAQQFKGSITVLNVYWDEPDSERREVLHRAEKRLIETFVKYQILSERNRFPPSHILRHAEDGGFDLITLGSRGRSASKTWVLGSVSSKVVDEAPCPVLVVR